MLHDRVALVTGASRGIGRGVASELARQGAKVFATGRTESDLATIGEGVIGIRCDHTADSDVEAAFQRIARDGGAIDILVNNVWGGYERMVDNGEFTWMKPFWQQPLWRWDAMFSAGVRAHYHASQLAAARHASRVMSWNPTPSSQRQAGLLAAPVRDSRKRTPKWCQRSPTICTLFLTR